MKFIDSETLYQKYIEENLNMDQCAIFFKISSKTVSKNIKHYNIVKKPGNIKRDYEKRIYQYNLDGIFIKEWSGRKEISKTLNIINTRGIQYSCTNKQNSAYGFIWKYSDDPETKPNTNIEIEIGIKNKIDVGIGIGIGIDKNSTFKKHNHNHKQPHLYKRYIYVFEFKKTNSVYVGLTWNLKKRKNSHLKSHKSSVFKHIDINRFNNDDFVFKNCGYYKQKIAQIQEGIYLKKYKNAGWNILNRTKTGGLGGNNLKWTFLNTQKEALKYNNRTEFSIDSNSAYSSALKNGWMDDVCGHMEIRQRPNGYWTKDRCHEISKLYKTKKEFLEYDKNTYKHSWKNGWLDEICNHMKLHIKKVVRDLEDCKKEALKYKTRTDFRLQSSKYYHYAWREKWLDTICIHMD